MRAPATRSVILLVTGLAATLLTGGCGESATTIPAAADIQGTPFRREATGSVGAGAAIGDLDVSPPQDLATIAPILPEVKSAPAAPKPGAADSYVGTSFEELAGFEYTSYASEETAKPEIPAAVRALSGKKVVVEGYLMPLSYEAGGAKKFLLMQNQFTCCYAITPQLNEWIEVEMQGGAVAEYIPHQLVSVWGLFEVVEEQKDGVSVGLYKMKGTRTEFSEAK